MKEKAANQKGAALIEAAIVTPLWIILCYGLVNLSFMFKEYSAINQATHEALNAGVRNQCSRDNNILKCDMTKVLPFDAGKKTFLEDVNAIDCLNDNSKPDCGRIIMAWNAFKVFQSMKKNCFNPRVEIEVLNGFSMVKFSCDYKYFNQNQVVTLTRAATGPYGTPLSH